MKKTLSVLLAALLLCSLCVIFAAAEDVNPDGYAFNIDSVNVAVAGEKTTIITKQDLIPTANMKWSVNIVLDKVQGRRRRGPRLGQRPGHHAEGRPDHPRRPFFDERPRAD